MQNAGQQYGQGGASSHQAAPFGGHTETSTPGGSITSSLRQFRRKNEDKQPHSDSNNTNSSTPAESHVARVAPHSHYPPRPTAECYRYPSQYPDYGLQQPVKYSEISEPHPPLQDHISPTAIQKAKSKEYMDMCNVQQQHMKPSFDHLNGQQTYPDTNVHPHAQYLHKEPQVHHGYKPESQYYPKDPQYSPQLPHQLQKYPQMPPQVRKYPPENDFLSKLRRIHPTMARSIMSDHHLQESQTSYQPIDQNRMYSLQNQRYINYPSGIQNSGYTHGYMSYTNYPASCSYNRPPQMTPRFPPVNPHERSISPRRGYPENMGIPMNYGGIAPQKISPNYPQYNTPEYAQHYQHRRAPTAQEYYQQTCRPTQYLPHQMPPQEMSESRVTVSDSIKHYIENWADEETASEMNQIENSRLCKDNIRGREDQSTETVYMINASELQYLENDIPLVTSENGVPVPVVASESGQYILKSGVSIVNGSEMMRIVEKTGQVEIDHNGERVVNLHIMDTTKPDCMMANKPNELNQRQANEPTYPVAENPRVVVHQNTVIAAAVPNPNVQKESEVEDPVKIGTSLPIITDTLEEELNRSIIKECRKETADKNCSPINLDQLEHYGEQEESSLKSSQNSLVEEIASIQEIPSPKIIPFIDAHLTNDNAKTETEEHQTSNLEVDDPHTHIDTLLEDTINTSEAIGIQTEAQLLEKNKTEIKINNEKYENEPVENQSVIQETLNISTEDKLVQEENKKDETENDDNISENIISQTPTTKETKENQETDNEETTDVKNSVVLKEEESLTKSEEDDVVENKNTISKQSNKNNEEIQNITEEKMQEGTEIKQNYVANIEDSNKKSSFLSTSIVKNDKSTTRRNRRIFSVDDIINNIGKKIKKPSDSGNVSRRHSLQTTKEFLDKEIKNTFKLTNFLHQKTNIPLKEKEEINEETNKKENIQEKIDTQDVIENKDFEKKIVDESIPISVSNEQKDNSQNVKMEVENEEVIEEEKVVSEETSNELKVVVSSPKNNPIIKDTKSNEEDNSKENKTPLLEVNKSGVIEEKIVDFETIVAEEPILVKDNNSELSGIAEIIEETEIMDEATNERVTKSSEVLHDLNKNSETNNSSDVSEIIIESKEIIPTAQPEVQYRNVIRVEESSVILEIAGELVEINVNNVNGKNVITVVPLSDTAMVDLNDNYETSEASDPLRLDEVPDHHENLEVVDFIEEEETEPEVVETSSEIIIGMDLSLEEEIKLDVDQPPVLCTKAAKKAYDCDLQIPSITTSEDVLDNSRSNSYTSNDKVSSTKEKSKSNTLKKKSSTPDSSKTFNMQKRLSKKPDKKSLFRDLIAARNRKKIKQDTNKPDDEDFVPFKELVRARKLKKLKLLKMKSNEDSRVDSTIKIDETRKETEQNKYEDDDDGDRRENKTIHPILKLPSEEESKSIKTDEKEKPRDDLNNVECPKPKAIKAKRVSFIDISQEIQSPENEKVLERKEIGNCKLEDPRLTIQNGILQSGQTKKKLSLEEYNKRKRKLQDATTKLDKEEFKKVKLDRSISDNVKNPEKIKPHRPKSLDDLNLLKSKDSYLTRRKLSVEYSPVKQNYFDWEETQSPKNNQSSKDKDNKFSEFKGLIGEGKTKPKVVIDVNDFNLKPSTESSEDEILQNYKVQVESKLSSLNIQIPRTKPTERQIVDPFSKSETNSLIDRFLRNEKLSSEEMEKIRKIISYKRLVQQLKKIKSPDISQSPTNPAYEVRKEMGKRETKLLLKKVQDKKKTRFRNLYSQSDSESEEDFREKPKCGAYSVVQSNCLAGVVPKLIIKRKTEMPLPIVRLERLDLGLLDDKNSRYAV